MTPARFLETRTPAWNRLEEIVTKASKREDISERFRRIDKAPMAAGIMTNNIFVAFNAFALGITVGVGTCFVVIFNSGVKQSGGTSRTEIPLRRIETRASSLAARASKATALL